MKQIIESTGDSLSGTFGNFRELLADILLSLYPGNDELVDEFSQVFQIIQFNLGDEIVNYDTSKLSVELFHNREQYQGFYLVCRGRVRLVGFDPSLQREVPASLLEVSDRFGTDELFDSQPVSYRAIAATMGVVAFISSAKLKHWFNKLPSLEKDLEQVVRKQQRLIFFKSLTKLRLLSSHNLKQFIKYSVETEIKAGELLHDFPLGNRGCFWLRVGEIQSRVDTEKQNQNSPLQPPPQVGESWGYPNEIPSDWVAQTDLHLYELPREDWEIVKLIAPILVDGETLPKRGRAKKISPLTLNLQSTNISESPSFVPPAAESKIIPFPQPAKQRKRGLGKSYPFVQQQSTMDCGAACLGMISQYWGKRFSLNMLRNLAGVNRSGATLKNLAVAAEKLGFHARPVRASLNRLVEEKSPWIAHWQGEHYVVVYRVKRNQILIADPAIAKRWLSIPDFQAGWTGYALLLSPTGLLQQIPNAKPTFGKIWGAFLPYSSTLLPIVMASILLQVFGLVTPLFTQIILDQVVVHKSFISLHVFAIGLLIFSVWRIGLGGVRQYLLDYFSNRVDLTLISAFVSHALNLPLEFFATRHVGDIITRVQENQKIQVFLTRQAVTTALDALMAFVYVGLMLYYNWQLTLLVLAILPPIIILTVVSSPMLRQVSRNVFHESAKQNSSLVEMFTGISTLKMAAAERDLRWLWEEHLTSMFNAQFQGQKLANNLQVIGGLINTVGSTALLWYGATLVMQDQLSIGQFVAFNMLIGNVITPVLSLVSLWDELQEVLVSVERLDDIFAAQPEESPDKPMLVLPNLHGEVQFENVSFRYNPDEQRNTLQSVTFMAHPGEAIAIVGRSGSGKSTLINLLQGLYHPTSGRILIDGYDIRHVSPQSLRRQLGVVPQECFLFSGTILENITLYRPEYELAEVVNIAKLAEAHAFIQNLPLGYNTKVGERGSALSGGQRQRIAIARALLANPRILILDEATSSLDTESERRFQDNLRRLCKERTTFIIAHRLSTVRNADCILVLDKGIIVERGNHEELMQQKGLYFHLAQQQLDI
ncbi:ABC transporter transmembrane domain-containing protein [Brunnivagina elsteri]|uniref:Peptidase C39 n=1 Tax=Brunnivagina elsteri CCALA 953 TaxID=987040 RepID=A0A2A2TLC7_9CYAN|nr:ABC transporter transmembrane domain-containing protein [Calothrix elsteri]PAX57942.1 peptidase C39 [Calothrix elsteri CCALA 953]